MKGLGSASDISERTAETLLTQAASLVGDHPRYELAVSGAASPSYKAVESVSFFVGTDEAAEPTWFLKVSEPALAGLLDAERAFEIAARLAALGLAPRPLHLAQQEGAILFERLGPEWRPATLDVLARPERRQTVIAAFARIAAQAPFGRTVSVFDGIRRMRLALGDDAPTLPPDAWFLFAEADSIEAALTAAGTETRPLHGDPHASNLLFGPGGELRFVDFDMAGDGDPHHQLGAFLNEACQFEEDVEAAIEMAEGTFRRDVFNRCRAYAGADDLYWGLRALLLDRISPRAGLEFRKYAGWRFLRCRMLLTRPGFEATLRHL